MMGAETPEGFRIARRSLEFVRRFVPGDGLEDEVLRRCIAATGDPSVKDIIAFKGDVQDGVEALRRRCRIIVDVKMVKAGLRRPSVAAVEFCVGNGEPSATAKATRVASGFRRIKEAVRGSFVAIGNSPSAAMALCEVAEAGYEPVFVVATPVGFVNAAEAKERIRRLDIPSITTVGSRGGSAMCVAIVNCLIEHAERPH